MTELAVRCNAAVCACYNKVPCLRTRILGRGCISGRQNEFAWVSVRHVECHSDWSVKWVGAIIL